MTSSPEDPYDEDHRNNPMSMHSDYDKLAAAPYTELSGTYEIRRPKPSSDVEAVDLAAAHLAATVVRHSWDGITEGYAAPYPAWPSGVRPNARKEDYRAVVREIAALLSPALPSQPAAVAWRVKDFADGWVYFTDGELAHNEADAVGALVQPLFLSPPSEAAMQPTPSAQARAEAIESAAQVAETYPNLWEEPECAAKDIRKLASAEIAAGIRALTHIGGGKEPPDARAAVMEEAAKLIEKGFHIQHPTKPAGVSVAYIEGDARRAAAIRALAHTGGGGGDYGSKGTSRQDLEWVHRPAGGGKER